MAAFAVHLFTASGAVLGIFALLAAVEQQWTLMFALLGAALIVDGIDGTIARRLAVAERLPRWSGDTLDLVVDFITYVFVPAYAIAAGKFLPPMLSALAAAAIVVSGAIYFADRNMKTFDNYFRGFPTLWNGVAFYFFLLHPDPWLAAAAVAVLVAFTFVPFPFLHPMRVARFRIVNIVMLALWSALALLALARDLAPGPWVVAALCAIGIYFLGAGLLRR